MPKGPQGQRRPADAVGCAVQVARIATGEEEETAAEKEQPSTLKRLLDKAEPLFKKPAHQENQSEL